MNIVGVLVLVRPERRRAVETALAAMPGVEVHEVSDDGRFVVTVEEPLAACAADTLLAIHGQPGVLSVTLVYHHFEPEADPADNRETGYATVTA